MALGAALCQALLQDMLRSADTNSRDSARKLASQNVFGCRQFGKHPDQPAPLCFLGLTEHLPYMPKKQRVAQ